MNIDELLEHRLNNQLISGSKVTAPEKVVSHMVAMQAQEFAMARWAIGLRSVGMKDADVERAFNEGAILRTHLMRPTWHFVAPADIRWMLTLTAPRVHAANAYMYRQLELDAAVFRKSNAAIENMLRDGNFLMRNELQEGLKKKKIIAEGHRLGYLCMHAELEGIICSGPRRGKQFTYALLEKRVPEVPSLSKEEALAEIGSRYFSTRGPASAEDLAYWSGLTPKDAKTAAAGLSRQFDKVVLDGREYFFNASRPLKDQGTLVSYLMPDYDEFGMSYKNRSALSLVSLPGLKNAAAAQSLVAGASVYDHWLVVEGRIAGTWERTTDGAVTSAKAIPFISLSKERAKAVSGAVAAFDSFMVPPKRKN